jgi:23S rRNA pseudouridine1911/1915/1917 synthase
MAHIRCPLVGDPLYGGRQKLPPGASAELRDTLSAFRRQALHAARLQLLHPASGEAVSWEAELPNDFKLLIEVLRSG